MQLAPKHVLSAGLFTLERAILLLRNSTYPGADVELGAINELANTIHNIPRLLLNWKSEQTLEEIRLELRPFKGSLWANESAPDFLKFFDEKLLEESQS